MEREIKFRVWHDGNKRDTGAYYKGHEPKMLYDIKPGDSLRWKNEGQNITAVMQFTGLVDADGKPIYEGDKVTHINGNTYVVQWNQLHCGWGLYLDGSMQRDLGADWITNKGETPERWENASLKVTGHIYEP